MSLFHPFKKKELEPTPKTYDSKASGTSPSFYKEDAARATAKKCKAVYRQGGPVAEAIDCYPLFSFTNGYTFEGEDQGMVEFVQDEFFKLDFDSAGHKAIVDSLVCGYAIQEIVPTKASGRVGQLIPRDAEDFEVKKDKYGRITGFAQVIEENGNTIRYTIPPEFILYVDLQYPLVARAYDDIIRDVKTADATANAIQRHGYPRYHIQVGAEGDKVSQQTIRTIGSEFERLKPGMELTTVRDVNVLPIDQGGIANVNEYNAWSTMRLSSALGVPEEILGLGRGSTEATANVRLKAFYDKIGSIQARLARAYQPLIDKITNRPGAVRLVFNDVFPEDEMRAADYIAKLANIVPGDPYAILSPEQMREYLGFEFRDAPEEKEEKVEQKPQDSEEEKPAQVAL